MQRGPLSAAGRPRYARLLAAIPPAAKKLAALPRATSGESSAAAHTVVGLATSDPAVANSRRRSFRVPPAPDEATLIHRRPFGAHSESRPAARVDTPCEEAA